MERGGLTPTFHPAENVVQLDVTDWISAFFALLDGQMTPDLFKKWAGVFCLGAALQRRVWVKSEGKKIFPNLYVTLCGPSAAGKNVALHYPRELLTELTDHHIAPASLTAAALADELDEANVTVLSDDGRGEQFNSLTLVAQELGVLLPAYDPAVLNRLTDLYDCAGYSERTRSKGKITIPNVSLALVAGTTPDYLASFLPEGAWHQGFMSRMIVVYSEGAPRRALTEEGITGLEPLLRELISGLKRRAVRYGRMRWERPAFDEMNRWYLDGGRPAPAHPKLVTYLGRRHYNLIKLCMIFCLSRSGDAIALEDFERALDLLLETEAVMPDIFKAMRSGGDDAVIKEAWHFLYTMYMRNDHPVARHYLAKFLLERVPAHAVDRIIGAMEAAGLIKTIQVNKIGACYQPIKPDY